MTVGLTFYQNILLKKQSQMTNVNIYERILTFSRYIAYVVFTCSMIWHLI